MPLWLKKQKQNLWSWYLRLWVNFLFFIPCFNVLFLVLEVPNFISSNHSVTKTHNRAKDHIKCQAVAVFAHQIFGIFLIPKSSIKVFLNFFLHQRVDNMFFPIKYVLLFFLLYEKVGDKNVKIKKKTDFQSSEALSQNSQAFRLNLNFLIWYNQYPKNFVNRTIKNVENINDSREIKLSIETTVTILFI